MSKPSLAQSIWVLIGILGIYVFLMCIEPIVDGFLMWLDKLPAGERRFVLLAPPLALIAGLIARRLNEGGMRC